MSGELRQRRRELRRHLSARRKQVRAQLERHPAVQRSRRRRRAVRLAALGGVLLLLLLIRCDCERPAEPVVGATIPSSAPPAIDAGAKPARLTAKVQPFRRNGFGSQEALPPNWLDQFQLQVAARSPRLAQCFAGIDRPGALRWTCAVNAQSGVVSDHTLEPVGTSGELAKAQQECVLRALSEPPYRITPISPQALPARVGLVIEF